MAHRSAVKAAAAGSVLLLASLLLISCPSSVRAQAVSGGGGAADGGGGGDVGGVGYSTDPPVDPVCPAPLQACWNVSTLNSTCTDVTSDALNCGFCGSFCPTPSGGSAPECKAGVCTDCMADEYLCWEPLPSPDKSFVASWVPVCTASSDTCDVCPSGLSFCWGDGTPGSVGCIPSLDDPLNCGWCGGSCAITTSGTRLGCTNGTCDACPDGTSACYLEDGYKCIPTDADVNNCGGCGVQCPNLPDGSPQRCSAGQCIDCPASYKGCWNTTSGGSDCTVVIGDPLNCGDCGLACPILPGKATGVCNMDTCQDCPTGYSQCWSNPNSFSDRLAFRPGMSSSAPTCIKDEDFAASCPPPIFWLEDGGVAKGDPNGPPGIPGRPNSPPAMKKSPPPSLKKSPPPPTKKPPKPVRKSTPPPKTTTSKPPPKAASKPPPKVVKKSSPPPKLVKKSPPPPKVVKKSPPPPKVVKKSPPPPKAVKKSPPPPKAKKAPPPPKKL